jgi:citronellol/citronellal dehydrogenase
MSKTPNSESQRIYKDNLFDGQCAVISGGGSGIGLGTARELIRLGARVAICGRSQDKLNTALGELSAIRDASYVHAQPCDIRKPEEIDAFVDATLERFGHIDILFNNAGGQFPSPAHMISPKGFDAVVRNNLCGTFNLTAAVANKAMIPRKSGCVLNMIANILRGFPGMAHTGAARAGVENLTMSLSVEWARHNIRVNAIAPGIITSSGTERYPKEILKSAIASCPSKRAGTVDEVVAAVLFLISPASQYISGATLRIDGAHALHGDVLPV